MWNSLPGNANGGTVSNNNPRNMQNSNHENDSGVFSFQRVDSNKLAGSEHHIINSSSSFKPNQPAHQYDPSLLNQQNDANSMQTFGYLSNSQRQNNMNNVNSHGNIDNNNNNRDTQHQSTNNTIPGNNNNQQQLKNSMANQRITSQIAQVHPSEDMPYPDSNNSSFTRPNNAFQSVRQPSQVDRSELPVVAITSERINNNNNNNNTNIQLSQPGDGNSRLKRSFLSEQKKYFINETRDLSQVNNQNQSIGNNNNNNNNTNFQQIPPQLQQQQQSGFQSNQQQPQQSQQQQFYPQDPIQQQPNASLQQSYYNQNPNQQQPSLMPLHNPEDPRSLPSQNSANPQQQGQQLYHTEQLISNPDNKRPPSPRRFQSMGGYPNQTPSAATRLPSFRAEAIHSFPEDRTTHSREEVPDRLTANFQGHNNEPNSINNINDSFNNLPSQNAQAVRHPSLRSSNIPQVSNNNNSGIQENTPTYAPQDPRTLSETADGQQRPRKRSKASEYLNYGELQRKRGNSETHQEKNGYQQEEQEEAKNQGGKGEDPRQHQANQQMKFKQFQSEYIQDIDDFGELPPGEEHLLNDKDNKSAGRNTLSEYAHTRVPAQPNRGSYQGDGPLRQQQQLRNSERPSIAENKEYLDNNIHKATTNDPRHSNSSLRASEKGIIGIKDPLTKPKIFQASPSRESSADKTPFKQANNKKEEDVQNSAANKNKNILMRQINPYKITTNSNINSSNIVPAQDYRNNNHIMPYVLAEPEMDELNRKNNSNNPQQKQSDMTSMQQKKQNRDGTPTRKKIFEKNTTYHAGSPQDKQQHQQQQAQQQSGSHRLSSVAGVYGSETSKLPIDENLLSIENFSGNKPKIAPFNDQAIPYFQKLEPKQNGVEIAAGAERDSRNQRSSQKLQFSPSSGRVIITQDSGYPVSSQELDDYLDLKYGYSNLDNKNEPSLSNIAAFKASRQAHNSNNTNGKDVNNNNLQIFPRSSFASPTRNQQQQQNQNGIAQQQQHGNTGNSRKQMMIFENGNKQKNEDNSITSYCHLCGTFLKDSIDQHSMICPRRPADLSKFSKQEQLMLINNHLQNAMEFLQQTLTKLQAKKLKMYCEFLQESVAEVIKSDRDSAQISQSIEEMKIFYKKVCGLIEHPEEMAMNQQQKQIQEEFLQILEVVISTANQKISVIT